MARFMSLVVGFCAAVLVLGIIGGFLISPTPPARSAKATPARPEFPGVARMGEATARELWRTLGSTQGIYRRDCADEICTVMMDPAIWRQLPYDLKRDVAAGMGIGAAAAMHARWTYVVDMYSGKRLARYSARLDEVRIE